MDAKLNIEREDMALLGEVNLSLRLQKRKVCHLFSVEATSEGYETMTEASEVIGHRPVKTCLLGGGGTPRSPLLPLALPHGSVQSCSLWSPYINWQAGG